MCKIIESFIFKEMTKERLQGHACIFAANVIFGIYIPISKYLVANCMSGEMLTLFRMWGAAILFWISSIFVKADKVDRRDLALMFVFSLFGVVLNQGVFIYGLGKTSPVDASVIVTMTPLMVLIISALFMGDPVTSRKLTGVFTGAAGAIWLILSAKHAVNSTGTASGDLLILLSGLASAIYFAMSKPLTSRHSPITLMKWMFLFASIMFLPITPSITCAPDAFKDNFGAADLAMLLYVVAGATFITYLLIAMAIKRMRPTTMAMYNYVQPFVASMVAVYLGQDDFSWEKVAAALLVFTGVYLVTSSHQAKAKSGGAEGGQG